LKFDLDIKPCPYKNKCTYGSKCKYYHPERGLQQQIYKTAHQSVLEEAQEAKNQIIKAQKDQKEKKTRQNNTVPQITSNKNTSLKPLTSVEIMKSPFSLNSSIDTKIPNEYANSLDLTNEQIFKNKFITSNKISSNMQIDNDQLRKRTVYNPQPHETNRSQISTVQNPTLYTNPQMQSGWYNNSTNTEVAQSNYQHFPGTNNNSSQSSFMNSFQISDAKQDRYFNLCQQLKSEEKAKWCIDEYPDETDEQKLIYLVHDAVFFDH
jgi:hypothetical protein